MEMHWHLAGLTIRPCWLSRSKRVRRCFKCSAVEALAFIQVDRNGRSRSTVSISR